MHKFLFLAVLAAVIGVASPAMAGRHSVGIGTGTLGIGFDATIRMNDMLAIRANANLGYFELPDFLVVASRINGKDYDFKADLASGGLLVDLYPAGGATERSGLVVSGGVYLSGNEFILAYTPDSGTDIGGTSYTPGQVGTLSSTVGFRSFAPYLGVGFTDTLGESARMSFFVRGGVLFQGPPSVTMTSSAGFVANGDLAAEAAVLETKLGFLEFYPAISAGVAFRF